MRKSKKKAKKARSIHRSWGGTLLIVAGVSLALFPFLSRAYDSFFPPEPVEEELKEVLTADREEIPFILPAMEIEHADQNGGGASENIEQAVESFPDKLLAEEKAVLHIPKLKVMTKVNYGVELEDLRKLPGFYPQSGYPDTGNVSIAAHRDAWFKDLDKLENGDEIRLYYNSKVYIYSVEEVFITHSRDWSVIDPTPRPALTLTTCHPPGLGAAPYRLIARAYLEEAIPAAE